MPRGNHKANVAEELGIIFNDCQKTFAAHKRSLSAMKSMYEDDKADFTQVPPR